MSRQQQGQIAAMASLIEPGACFLAVASPASESLAEKGKEQGG